MQLKQRIEAFVHLGEFITRHLSNTQLKEEGNLHLGLTELIKTAKIYNGWFTEDSCALALKNIAFMLKENDLKEYCKNVQAENKSPKTVAIICAGNIPVVGFHDIMSVLLSGNIALIKLSSDDNVLIPFFLKLLIHYQPELDALIHLSDGKLSNFDAVIATGSNNTAGYFDYYFGKYPNIIRKNRSSLAILRGNESTEQLKELGKDIFSYYGLGCRNVSKLLVPDNYNFKDFFEAIFDYGHVVDNKKYGNNYDYNRAVFLLNKEPFLDNNFLILKPDNQIHAPISVVFYENYKSQADIDKYITENKNEIQCIVGENYIPFGNSQQPVITDFADGVNTLEFLVNL